MQQQVAAQVFTDTPFLVDLIKQEMDDEAARKGFGFHAAEWNIAMPISQHTHIVRMYVAREAAD